MENHGFFTVLFMWIAGIFFIIGSIFPLLYSWNFTYDVKSFQKDGVTVEAEVVYEKETEYEYSYKVKYIVNNKEYIRSVDLTPSIHNLGDKVKIEYLPNNPKKIIKAGKYKNMEVSYTNALPVIGIWPLGFGLGYLCMKKFNILKYKRIIEVK